MNLLPERFLYTPPWDSENGVDFQVCGKAEHRKVKYVSPSPSLGFYENKCHVDTVKMRKCSFCLPSFLAKPGFVRYAQVSESSGIMGSILHSDLLQTGQAPDRMSSLLGKAEARVPT